jgi:hypothetical protein
MAKSDRIFMSCIHDKRSGEYWQVKKSKKYSVLFKKSCHLDPPVGGERSPTGFLTYFVASK